MEQRIRFCKASDGVSIAYATVGAGPPLVKAANWLSHLEYDWESPVWRHWYQELAKHNLLIRYDERGCGLSDWQVGDFSFEAWVRDLETVVEAANIERFPLLGISQGGAVAVAYAQKNPDRVSHLILYGAYARGYANRNLSKDVIEEREAMKTLMRIGWGKDHPTYRRLFTAAFMPGGTEEHMQWFNDLQRMSASAENAVRFAQEFEDIDVTSIAPKITVPTLILHCRDDAVVPFEEGRRLAALIPEAHFVPLDGNNHLMVETEPAWEKFLAEVRGFLGIEVEPTREASRTLEEGVIHQESQTSEPGEKSQARRVLATVLFTDIVSSTDIAAAEGDQKWLERLKKHNVKIREALEKFRGREIKVMGDGFLAIFDAPAKAIQCAIHIVEIVKELEIEVRCGIHTGEVEWMGEDLGGIGIHIAARLLKIAGASEVLVSSTVRELVTGAGFEFEDMGQYKLKGVSQEWRVFSVAQ